MTPHMPSPSPTVINVLTVVFSIFLLAAQRSPTLLRLPEYFKAEISS